MSRTDERSLVLLVLLAAVTFTCVGPERYVRHVRSAFSWGDGARWDAAWQRARFEHARLRLPAALGQYEAAELAARSFRADDPRRLDALRGEAVVARELGRYGQAEGVLLRLLAVERARGRDTVAVAALYNELASVRLQQADAGPDVQKLVERAAAVLVARGAAATAEHGTTLHNQAMLLHYRHRFAAAERAYRQGLAVRLAALGPRHPDVAESYGDLGLLLVECGQRAAGCALVDQALRVYRESLGAEHPWVAWYEEQLGVAQLKGGERQAARARLETARALRARVLGAEHPLTRRSTLLAGMAR